MKKIVIAAWLASCTVLNVQAADPATVNGEPIPQSLVDYIAKDAAAQGKQVDDDARAKIIDKLITTELIDQAAKKAGIDKQPDFLVKESLIRRELRVNAYLEDYVKKNPVDEAVLHLVYDNFKAQLSGKEYKARHILVETEEQAKNIVSQLAKGADFAKIAKEKSLDTGSRESGGNLDWFQADAMVKPFSDAVVKLQKGSYTTAPVQTEFGWHVIRLDDVRDTQPPSFESVRKELSDDLQRQQLEKLVNELRAKAKVVKNIEGLPAK